MMNATEEKYRQEWVGRTGRASSDIYIPLALREEPVVATENPTAKFILSFDDDEVELELEFKFSDNADQFLDITTFVNLAAQELLQAIAGE